MLENIKFWLEASRVYALPMSIFSWLIIFSYSIQHNGNALYGFIALIGVCIVHLAVNLFDDFCDYHLLEKEFDYNNNIVLPNTQRGKCKYIIDKKVKLFDIVKTLILYGVIATLVGGFFYFSGYKDVLIYMAIGIIIALFYPFLSYLRLSELAVGIAFGGLLFGGVYYVMTGNISADVFILSIPSTIFTINLLYTDNFLDKDIDKKEGKRTLISLFKDENSALHFQKILLILGYLSIFLIPIFDIADWEVFLTFITLPLAADLLHSLRLYSNDKTNMPDKKWYHFPFENWDSISETDSQSFMFRMYQARNLMVWSSLILAITIWFN